MVTWILVIMMGLAFLSGPSAFLLLWLTWRKTRAPGLPSLALALVGLFFILVGNTVTLLSGAFGPGWDTRMAFLTMTAVFLATVMTAGFVTRYAHQITQAPVTRYHQGAFWGISILALFLAQGLPLFVEGPGTVSLENGYLAATAYGAVCQLYATVLVVRRRFSLLPLFGRRFPWYVVALGVLSVISVLNDVFHFGPILQGPDVPFSPLFFLLVNASVVAFCARTLVRSPGNPGPGPDFGYTDRERELVPLLLEGLSNDEIGERLFISSHTVKNHITSIYRKAGVSNRLELVKKSSS